MSPTHPARPGLDQDGTLAAITAAACASLTPFVSGYTEYWERPRTPVTRREVASLQWVLIVNLGAPIGVTAGDGRHLCLQAGEGFITGLHDRHAFSHSHGSQAGIQVSLTPLGATRLLGDAAGAIANQGVRLADILGPDGADLGCALAEATDSRSRFATLDRALCRWMARAQRARPEIDWAFAQLRANPARPIAALAGEIGWSRKTLSRHFTARLGIAPRTAARLARFQRVIASCDAGRADWAALAQDHGYFDQSHMIRDFSAFAGLSPARYLARLIPAHGLIEPAG